MKNPELTPEKVTGLLKAHNRFFRLGLTREAAFRLHQLKKLQEGIRAYETRIIDALRLDLGKSPFESYTSEIGFVLNNIAYAMKHLKKWAEPKKVKTPFLLPSSTSLISYEPYGTVLIIGPFNYPFQLLIEPLIGAIAAGNCAVLKPSEQVPHTAAVITEMIGSIFDTAYIRAVNGGTETSDSLVNAPFDYIFFTGSVPVGKKVMQAAATHLVPVTLELGGKSPVIVDRSADIKTAARRIIWGKTLNAGQTCVAPDYVMVQEEVKKELIREMKQALNSFYGPDIKASKDFGRIVNLRHFERLKAILEKDRDQILFGGASDPETRFMEPTLIAASWDSASMEEELFGPLLPILTYTDLDQAILSINKRSKPLALYLFTTDKKVEEKVIAAVSSGGVSVNSILMHLLNPELPFGGVGHSGIGSYHGRYSFTAFSHQKSILKTGTRWDIPLLYPPYKDRNLQMIRRFFR